MKRDAVENLVPPQIIALARFCQAALIILNARLMMLLAMLLAAGLFAWTMADPHWIRFAGACAFALLVFLPAYTLESKRRKEESNET